jgi:hypothetical protein
LSRAGREPDADLDRVVDLIRELVA